MNASTPKRVAVPDSTHPGVGLGADHVGHDKAPFPGIWAFIAADCASFGIFFAVFMVERMDRTALFDASARTLDTRLGLLNTLILITSSWLVALAVNAARREDLRAFRKLWLGAIVVASGFAVIKLIEYGTKIGHGITPLTNDFYAYYFILTGAHFVHYLIGMAVLVFLARKRMTGATIDPVSMNWIESSGIYWHMVDLLWVVLFPMLYLLGGT